MALEFKIQNQNGQVKVLDQDVNFWANENTINANLNFSINVSINRKDKTVSITCPIEGSTTVEELKVAIETVVKELDLSL